MCYTRRKIEGGVGALREPDDTNFLKPNGQSRNLHIYDWKHWREVTSPGKHLFVQLTQSYSLRLFDT